MTNSHVSNNEEHDTASCNAVLHLVVSQANVCPIAPSTMITMIRYQRSRGDSSEREEEQPKLEGRLGLTKMDC